MCGPCDRTPDPPGHRGPHHLRERAGPADRRDRRALSPRRRGGPDRRRTRAGRSSHRPPGSRCGLVRGQPPQMGIRAPKLRVSLGGRGTPGEPPPARHLLGTWAGVCRRIRLGRNQGPNGLFGRPGGDRVHAGAGYRRGSVLQPPSRLGGRRALERAPANELPCGGIDGRHHGDGSASGANGMHQGGRGPAA